MAHWAKIENGIVVQITVGSNNDLDEGYQWLIDNLGGTWIKTSYNNNIRKQYAGIGFSYDPVADVFIAPQPYPSWSLDADHNWQPPTPRPEGMGWYWDEAILSWVEA